MQAIEFETHLKDGMMQLPTPYRHWRKGQPVKVMVLAADRDAPPAHALQRHAGTLALTEDPLTFQAALRNAWT